MSEGSLVCTGARDMCIMQGVHHTKICTALIVHTNCRLEQALGMLTVNIQY